MIYSRQSYTKFNMEVPEFPFYDDIENDLEKQQNMWKCFEEFYEGIEKLSNEEWIVFRKKSYRLEEFLHEWQTKLKKTENTPLVTRLLQEIHKYQVGINFQKFPFCIVFQFQEIIPILKYIRGEDFTEKHWMEIFHILGIIPKPIDILNLKDFLNVSDALVENQKELQVLPWN